MTLALFQWESSQPGLSMNPIIEDYQVSLRNSQNHDFHFKFERVEQEADMDFLNKSKKELNNQLSIIVDRINPKSSVPSKRTEQEE